MDQAGKISKPGDHDYKSTPASSTVDSVSTRAHNAIDKVAASAQPAINRLSSDAHDVVERAATATSDAAETLDETAARLKRAQAEFGEQCRNYVQDNPLLSVGIAVAAGFVLSKLFLS